MELLFSCPVLHVKIFMRKPSAVRIHVYVTTIIWSLSEAGSLSPGAKNTSPGSDAPLLNSRWDRNLRRVNDKPFKITCY